MLLSVIKYAVVEGADPEIQKPERTTDGAVGYDAKAFRVQDPHSEDRKPYRLLPVTINPGNSELIGIGIIMAVPQGYQAEVRPRSGLASKDKIQLLNSPGTIDPDFRGEAGVLLYNVSDKPFTVKLGMRIAQLVITKVELPDFVYILESKLPKTSRDAGGFGSTGLMEIDFGTKGYDAAIHKLDRYFMEVVLATAGLSNCVRGCQKDNNGNYLRDENGGLIGQKRKFGCVVTKDFRIIASGFNAQYPGSDLCSEVGCLRDELKIPSGEQIEKCRAIHAEQMAINAAAKSGESIEDATMYVNAEPCLQCARLITGLGLEALVVLEEGYSTKEGLKIVADAGIRIRSISL